MKGFHGVPNPGDVSKNWLIVIIAVLHAEHQGKELLVGSKQGGHARLSEVSYKQWHSRVGVMVGRSADGEHDLHIAQGLLRL